MKRKEMGVMTALENIKKETRKEGGGDGGESDRGRAESETIAKKKVAWN